MQPAAAAVRNSLPPAGAGVSPDSCRPGAGRLRDRANRRAHGSQRQGRPDRHRRHARATDSRYDGRGRDGGPHGVFESVGHSRSGECRSGFDRHPDPHRFDRQADLGGSRHDASGGGQAGPGRSSAEILRALFPEAVAYHHARAAQPHFGHPPLQGRRSREHASLQMDARRPGDFRQRPAPVPARHRLFLQHVRLHGGGLRNRRRVRREIPGLRGGARVAAGRHGAHVRGRRVRDRAAPRSGLPEDRRPDQERRSHGQQL